MKFTATDIGGVTVVDIEPHNDERGFSACSFCADEFAKHGLDSTVAQVNYAYNHVRGTLRGLHTQAPPFAQATPSAVLGAPFSPSPLTSGQNPRLSGSA